VTFYIEFTKVIKFLTALLDAACINSSLRWRREGNQDNSISLPYNIKMPVTKPKLCHYQRGGSLSTLSFQSLMKGTKFGQGTSKLLTVITSLGKVRPQNHSNIMQFAPIFKWTYSQRNKDIFLYLCLCLELILSISVI
jgi:hypothetical protein